MTEVSIIVPVYNAAKYLQNCIDSIRSQQFTDWELILVDDGSTDSSLDICRHAAETDSRISVISKSNGGLSSARNTGIASAKGRYITFVDADDELYPHSINHLRRIAERYSVSVAAGRAIYSESKPAASDKRPITDVVNSRHRLADILYQKPRTDNTAWGKLYHRRIFDDLRFYEGWYEDLEITPKILKKIPRLAITDSIVYFYRRRPDSFINSWSDGRRDILPVTEAIVNSITPTGDTLLIGAARHRQFSAAFNLLTALLQNRPDDHEAIEKCMTIIRSLRHDVLRDGQSRLKNRIGALASYGGINLIRLIAR